MSSELIYIRFLQFAVLALTFVLVWAIRLGATGKLELHRKVMGAILAVTGIAVLGLILTLIMGFDYASLKTSEALIDIGPEDMKTRMLIHRAFSVPLFFSLLYSTFSGAKRSGKAGHKAAGYVSFFFWLGTLITALLFF